MHTYMHTYLHAYILIYMKKNDTAFWCNAGVVIVEKEPSNHTAI